MGDIFGEFIEEVFVNAANNVAFYIIQSTIVKDPQQFSQKLIGEHGIVFGQHAGQLFTLFLHQLHGVVNDFAQAVHYLAGSIGQLGSGDILRQLHQIGILGLPGQE